MKLNLHGLDLDRLVHKEVASHNLEPTCFLSWGSNAEVMKNESNIRINKRLSYFTAAFISLHTLFNMT